MEFPFSKFKTIVNKKFSILLSPGKYLVDVSYVVPMETAITGNQPQQTLDQLKEEGRKVIP
jgi:hypothetical protein